METNKWSEKYKKSIDCSNPKGFSQRAHCQGRKKKLAEAKADMPCNKPRPSTSPGKKMMVKACEGGQEKLVHFGAKGYGHNYSAAARKSFRARHKCGEKKSKLSAQYWACKKLWAGPKGSKAACPSNRQCKECYETEINNLIKEALMEKMTPEKRTERRKIVKALMDKYPESRAYAIATSQVMKKDVVNEQNVNTGVKKKIILTPKQKIKRDKLAAHFGKKLPQGKAFLAATTIVAKKGSVNEEIVNPDNKGTMTRREIISRDRKARTPKIVKNIRAIKGNDTEENAKYRFATYLQIRMRGGKKGKVQSKKGKKSKLTKKQRTASIRSALSKIDQQREVLKKEKQSKVRTTEVVKNQLNKKKQKQNKAKRAAKKVARRLARKR